MRLMGLQHAGDRALIGQRDVMTKGDTHVKKKAIAVDVGGHGAKGVVVDEDGRQDGATIVRQYPSVIRQPGIDKRDVPGKERWETVGEIISALRGQHPDITHIGIATTGTVDQEKGVIIRDQSPTYQGTNWPRTLLDAHVIASSDIICVQNDAKAGAWAEYQAWPRHPLAKQRPDPLMFVRITVGSGVGSAIVYDRKLIQGAGHVAGEFTYMPFRPAPGSEHFIPLVQCGDQRFGCTESYAASPGILRGARQAVAQGRNAWARGVTDPETLTLADVAAAYRGRDETITGVVQTASAALGSAILNIIYLLGPEVVVVGGGVLEQIPDYFTLACNYVKAHGVIAPAVNAALLVQPQIPSNDAAAIGVALLTFRVGRRASDLT